MPEYVIGDEVFETNEELTPAELEQLRVLVEGAREPEPEAEAPEDKSWMLGRFAGAGKELPANQSASNIVQGLIRGAGRAVPLGLDAKTVAGTRAPFTDKTYDEEKRQYLADTEAIKKRNPGAYLLGYLGNLALMLGSGGRVLQGAGVGASAAKVLSAMGLGGAEGYTSAAEEDRPMEERLNRGVWGAGIGGLLRGLPIAGSAAAKTKIGQQAKAALNEVISLNKIGRAAKAAGRAYDRAKAAGNKAESQQLELLGDEAPDMAKLFKKIKPKGETPTVKVPTVGDDVLLAEQDATRAARGIVPETPKAAIPSKSTSEIATDPAFRPTLELPALETLEDRIARQARTRAIESGATKAEAEAAAAKTLQDFESDAMRIPVMRPGTKDTIEVPTLEAQGLLPRVPKDDADLMKALQQSVDMVKRKPPPTKDAPLMSELKGILRRKDKKNVSEFGLNPDEARYVNQLENRSSPAVAPGMEDEMGHWEDLVEEFVDKGMARQKAVERAYDVIRRPGTPKGR